ncbi:MAG: PilW family protein [Solirubrobacteraceae bacterium]
MLTVPPHPSASAAPKEHPSLSGEDGYTLMEMLVAIVTGLVVCLALFAILDFSTRQETRLNDMAQATQLGRLAMTRIVDELHSACIAPSFTPILEGSNANELRFINAYSEKAVISETKPEAYKQKIVWNEKAETLTDYTYTSNGGTWPNFTFSEVATPAAGVLLATHVKQSKTEPGEKTIPIFQYYSYTGESNENETTGLNTLNAKPLEVPLEKKTAPTAASVLVSFNTGPTESTASLGASLGKKVTLGLQSQVTLSFAVPISNAESVDAPCQ